MFKGIFGKRKIPAWEEKLMALVSRAAKCDRSNSQNDSDVMLLKNQLFFIISVFSQIDLLIRQASVAKSLPAEGTAYSTWGGRLVVGTSVMSGISLLAFSTISGIDAGSEELQGMGAMASGFIFTLSSLAGCLISFSKSGHEEKKATIRLEKVVTSLEEAICQDSDFIAIKGAAAITEKFSFENLDADQRKLLKCFVACFVDSDIHTVTVGGVKELAETIWKDWQVICNNDGQKRGVLDLCQGGSFLDKATPTQNIKDVFNRLKTALEHKQAILRGDQLSSSVAAVGERTPLLECGAGK